MKRFHDNFNVYGSILQYGRVQASNVDKKLLYYLYAKINTFLIKNHNKIIKRFFS